MKPSVPIKPTLEKVGYPFKSKYHSMALSIYQNSGDTETVDIYLKRKTPKSGIVKHPQNLCPKMLEYQFTPEFNIKISPKCCNEMKKKPIHEWQKANNKPYSIIGIMREEGGQRISAQCLRFKNEKFTAFQPLAPMTKEWEEWFIQTYNIDISDIYKPPYNFERTGCKGCPFALHLQNELDTLDKFFPAERKQCEIIWKPIYDEYRRIGYRLRPLDEGRQMTLEEFQ